MPRETTPGIHPFVNRLTDDGDTPVDVVVLVGYVGAERDGRTRIYADADLQRWLEVPTGAIIDSRPVEEGADDFRTRNVVWVTRTAMAEKMFQDEALTALDSLFDGGAMSTWPLIPDSLFMAAEMLGLLRHEPRDLYEEGVPS